MLKKFIIASAILAATSTVALASGPYVGGSIGVNTSTFAAQSNVGNNASVDFGGRNAIGNLFAGYGTMVNSDIYLGGEAFADLTNTSAEAKAAGISKTSFNQRYGYGVSVIPGVMLTDHTMAYGRAGVVRSRFEFNDQYGPFSSTKRQTVTGGQLGLGLQTSLTQNLDLRGEYDYTRYRTVKFNDATSVDPRSDSFNVGLVYKFD